MVRVNPETIEMMVSAAPLREHLEPDRSVKVCPGLDTLFRNTVPILMLFPDGFEKNRDTVAKQRASSVPHIPAETAPLI